MKRTTMILVGCLAIGVGQDTAFAQNAPDNNRSGGQADTQKPVQGQKNAAKNASHNMNLAHASQFMDMTVRDPQGKHIGEVEDMIIDSQGRVAFVILSFEDEFVGDDLFYAVPPQVLSHGSDPDGRDLILRTSKETFTVYSGFSAERYPQFDEDNTRATYKRFGQTPYWEGDMNDRKRDQSNRNQPQTRQDRDKDARDQREDARERRQDRTDRVSENRDANKGNRGLNGLDGPMSDEDRRRAYNEAPQFDLQNAWTSRADEIIGQEVVNNNNEDLGRIKNLLVDVRENRVLYAVLSDGGFLNLGETFTVVPYSALKASGSEQRFTLDATEQSLKPLSFKESAWPDLTNRQWVQSVHAQFNQDPYWASDRQSNAGTDDMKRHWRSDSDYNKHYDAKQSKTIKGTVTSVSEFSPEEGASMGRQLMLRGEDGTTTTVHLGPSAYMQLQDSSFTIKEGDKLTVTGSACEFKGKDVMMANKIQNEQGKTLELRGNNGQPHWDNEDKDNQDWDKYRRADRTDAGRSNQSTTTDPKP